MKKETSRLSAATVALVDVLLALVLVGLLFGFYSARIFSRVQGNDMFPTYRNSDFLLCKKGGLYKRGDILCFRAGPGMRTEREKDLSIRRIVGLPGETVEITPEGTVLIDGRPLEEDYLEPGVQAATYREGGTMRVTLGNDEFFLLGDDRAAAFDSRDYGPVNTGLALGVSLAHPDMTAYILTLVLPLCLALAAWWAGDYGLRQLGKKR